MVDERRLNVAISMLGEWLIVVSCRKCQLLLAVLRCLIVIQQIGESQGWLRRETSKMVMARAIYVAVSGAVSCFPTA